MKRRSSTAIKLWLQTRYWYKNYVRNLKTEYEDGEEVLNFINGLMGEMTLSSAFCYRNTPEGIEYWGKKEKKFLQWYYCQGNEIFRCKWFRIKLHWL